MSKQGRISAELSDENFDFFEAEMRRLGVKQATPMLNMLLSELRHLRTEMQTSAQIRIPSSPRQ